jgi:PGF-pre-PGF domain-containing protein
MLLFNYNLTNSTLNLTEVIIITEDIENASKVIVSGLNLPDNTTKTVYFDLLGNKNIYGSLCVKDAELLSFSEFTSNCSGLNETYFLTIPSNSGGLSIKYTNSSNTTVSISGLSHSGIIQICTESWDTSSWSTCSESTQTRTVIDANNCGTSFHKPITSQSCTIEEDSGSSRSSSSSSGGGLPDLGLTTTVYVKDIAEQKMTSFKINASNISVSQIQLKLNVNKTTGGLKVSNIKMPDEAKSITKKVYEYLSIIPRSILKEEIEGGEIDFIVDSKWLDDNNIDEKTVTLLRFVDDTWVELDTQRVGSVIDGVKFRSITPGFSYFAIAGEELSKVEIIPENITMIKNNTNKILKQEFNLSTEQNITDSNNLPQDSEETNNFWLSVTLIVFSIIIILILIFKKDLSKKETVSLLKPSSLFSVVYKR